MPFWVKEYKDTNGLNLISSTDVFVFSSAQKCDAGGSCISSNCISLQLTWKQSDNLSTLSFSSTSPSSSNVNGETPLQEEKYVVILDTSRICNSKNGCSMFKLYSSKHKNKAEEALQNIQAILKHLVTVPLSPELLSFLILPTPKPLEDLPQMLVEYALKLPPASVEWAPLASLVINGLPLAYIMCELTNMSILKALREAGVNLVLSHPHTGATLVHLAAQTSDESLRLIIDYLNDDMSRESYQKHIDKPCQEDSIMTGTSPARRSSSLQRASQSLSLMTEKSKEKILRRSSADPTPSILLKPQTLTPLMRAIKRNCVRSVNYLLVLGASTNYQDPASGVTALHLAAAQCNVAIIKLLLSFEANMMLQEKEGRTPLDIARKNGALDCIDILETVASLRTKRDIVQQEQASIDYIPSDKVTLLAIDGGGTRGCLCSYIIYYIEQKMRKLTRNPNLQIREYFNWFSGTSIGGFFALCMSHANLDTHTTMSTVVNNRLYALAGKKVYDGATQEAFHHKIIGDIGLKDIKEPKALVMTVRADLDPPKLIHITNYRDDPGDGREWKAWQAVRASSAAPLYFPCYDQKYVDGGILAINPTQYALHDIHVYEGKKVGLVLSLGTGVFQSNPNELSDLVRPRLTHLVSDIQKDVKFLKNLTSMLTANMVESEDTVQHSKCWCESQGGIFHRLSPPLTQRFVLDEKTDEGFVLFFYETYLYLLDIDNQITDIARYLISHGVQWSFL